MDDMKENYAKKVKKHTKVLKICFVKTVVLQYVWFNPWYYNMFEPTCGTTISLVQPVVLQYV